MSKSHNHRRTTLIFLDAINVLFRFNGQVISGCLKTMRNKIINRFNKRRMTYKVIDFEANAEVSCSPPFVVTVVILERCQSIAYRKWSASTFFARLFREIYKLCLPWKLVEVILLRYLQNVSNNCLRPSHEFPIFVRQTVRKCMENRSRIQFPETLLLSLYMSGRT